MLIDWFTVGAQVLNFVILVWLMRRFLYQPVLNAIDTREKRIAAELADADSKRAEAQKERAEFQRKNEEFDSQRAALLSQATEEAKKERQRLLEEARKTAEEMSAKRQKTLTDEAQHLSHAILTRTREEVFAIARKALSDLATTGLEERLGEVFTRRLRGLDGPAKSRLAEAIKSQSQPGVVRTAFDLPAAQRATIQNAINETFSADIQLRFEIAPEIVSGIELTTNGQKIAWSIDDYLGAMERGVTEVLSRSAKSEPAHGSGSQAEVTTALQVS